jgi:hypothetical protein
LRPASRIRGSFTCHAPALTPQPADSPEPELKPKVEPNAAGLLPGDDVIDSDLDDSDDELQGDVEGQDEVGEDIVFCVYDKVSEVIHGGRGGSRRRYGRHETIGQVIGRHGQITDGPGAARQEQVEDGV